MTLLKTEKIRKILALLIGIAVLISGIVILGMSDSHTGNGEGVSRASTSIEFGADYYTTSAQYMGLAANAACDIFKLVKLGFGLMFLFAGLFMLLHFGFDLFYIIQDEKEKEEHFAIKESMLIDEEYQEPEVYNE